MVKKDQSQMMIVRILISNIDLLCFVDIPIKKQKKKQQEPLSGNFEVHGMMSQRSSVKD